MARPPLPFDPTVAERICLEVSEGSNLNRIKDNDWCPSMDTVYKWLKEHEAFADSYARAREARADRRAERIDDICMKVEAGEIDYNAARVIIDAQKWQAAHEAPKAYGDRDRSASVTVDLSGLHITALQQRTTPKALIEQPHES